MFLKRFFSLLIVTALLIPPNTSYAQIASDALIGTALKYFKQGFYQEALHEFSKVLLVEPDNEQAKFYIQQIRNRQDASREEQIIEALDKFEPAGKISPEAKAIIINRELDKKITTKKIRRLPFWF